MSQVLELAELVAVADGFGTVPLLLTVDDSGRPRAAAVTVDWDGAVAVVHAGHRSVANARQRPLVSLLWPAPPGERFALLVDGEARDVRDDPPPAAQPDQHGTARPTASVGRGSSAKPGRTPGAGRTPKAGGTLRLDVTSAMLHVVSS